MWHRTIDYTNYYVFVLGVDFLRDWFIGSDLETDYWFDFCFELENKIGAWDIENGVLDQSYYETIRDYLNLYAEQIAKELKERFPHNMFGYMNTEF